MEELVWHDCRELTIEGRAWDDTRSYYDRLPARACGVVRDPVWDLAQHAAGICCRFATDATAIHARWELRYESLAMPHMPATGVSGLDLYVRVGGAWRWAGVGQPTQFPVNTAALASGMAAGQREYLLYLPLYNGVHRVEVGVSREATVTPGPARRADRRLPMVFYGTSITQGGCASRPGMAHVAILGRWLDRPVVNLGFSGNGTMDLSVAQLMAELEAAAWVIDCGPNMTAEAVAERTAPLVRVLRQASATTPIILVEDRTCASAHLLPGTAQGHAASRASLRAAFDALLLAGDEHLYYQPGAPLLGEDDEGTVDTSHPTDLGFFRQATAMRPLLESVAQH